MPLLKGIKLLKLDSVANHCPKRYYCRFNRVAGHGEFTNTFNISSKTLRDQQFVVQSKSNVNIILAVYYCGITFQVV